MDRKTLLVVLVSLVSMVTGTALYQLSDSNSATPGIQPLQPGLPGSETSPLLEAIPLIDLQGVSQPLGNWTQPVLVVNFWAPWCVPCRREVPDLIELQREYGDRVQILGLAFDSVDNIESFADEYQMNYPSFLANQHIPMYSAVFNNESGALPFTAIIGPNRKIGYSHTGIVSLQTLREQVSKLL
jgi:thiol-disulfide isomerase/thioredoxin